MSHQEMLSGVGSSSAVSSSDESQPPACMAQGCGGRRARDSPGGRGLRCPAAEAALRRPQDPSSNPTLAPDATPGAHRLHHGAAPGRLNGARPPGPPHWPRSALRQPNGSCRPRSCEAPQDEASDWRRARERRALGGDLGADWLRPCAGKRRWLEPRAAVNAGRCEGPVRGRGGL